MKLVLFPNFYNTARRARPVYGYIRNLSHICCAHSPCYLGQDKTNNELEYIVLEQWISGRNKM